MTCPFPQLSSENYSLKQFQYTGWPDYGVPQPTSLVKFIQQVRKAIEGTDAPIVVHCRWGEGCGLELQWGWAWVGDWCTHLEGGWNALLLILYVICLVLCETANFMPIHLSLVLVRVAVALSSLLTQWWRDWRRRRTLVSLILSA